MITGLLEVVLIVLGLLILAALLGLLVHPLFLLLVLVAVVFVCVCARRSRR